MGKIKELLDAEKIKPDFEKMNCGELVDYIISKHHQYALSAISQIRAILEQMVVMDCLNIELKLIKEYIEVFWNPRVLPEKTGWG